MSSNHPRTKTSSARSRSRNSGTYNINKHKNKRKARPHPKSFNNVHDIDQTSHKMNYKNKSMNIPSAKKSRSYSNKLDSFSPGSSYKYSTDNELRKASSAMSPKSNAKYRSKRKKTSSSRIKTSVQPLPNKRKKRKRKNKIKVIGNRNKNEWSKDPKKTVCIPTPLIFIPPSTTASSTVSRNRNKNKKTKISKKDYSDINYHQSLRNKEQQHTVPYIIKEDEEINDDTLDIHKKNKKKRYPSKPEYAESVLTEKPEKFNASEMKWVVQQIALMKKSWRTPIEEVQRSIYTIIDLEDRPHLNNQFVKVLLILDDENYRIQLCNNLHSEHVIPSRNLEIAFETENLFILFNSMNSTKHDSKLSSDTVNSNSMKKTTAYDIHQKQKTQKLKQPKPPKPNIDDLHTIAAFEMEFDEIYNFKRVDFHIICIFLFLSVIVCVVGLCLIIFTGEKSLGAVIMVYGPILCVIYGIMFGCLWFCHVVKIGKIDIYLGENKFFGYKCEKCDCCKYQYFVLVAVAAVVLFVFVSAVYVIFPQVKGEYVDERLFNLFFFISMMSAFVLFIGAVLICYCFRTWSRRDSIWEPSREKQYAD